MYKHKDILKFFFKVYMGAYWLVFVGLGLSKNLEQCLILEEDLVSDIKGDRIVIARPSLFGDATGSIRVWLSIGELEFVVGLEEMMVLGCLKVVVN